MARCCKDSHQREIRFVESKGGETRLSFQHSALGLLVGVSPTPPRLTKIEDAAGVITLQTGPILTPQQASKLAKRILQWCDDAERTGKWGLLRVRRGRKNKPCVTASLREI